MGGGGLMTTAVAPADKQASEQGKPRQQRKEGINSRARATASGASRWPDGQAPVSEGEWR
jgi:hypothetical protein